MSIQRIRRDRARRELPSARVRREARAFFDGVRWSRIEIKRITLSRPVTVLAGQVMEFNRIAGELTGAPAVVGHPVDNRSAKGIIRPRW